MDAIPTKEADSKGLVAGWLSLDEFLALPRNPKDHDLGELHGAIGRFGFLDRCIINRATGHVIAGHGRCQVLRQKQNAGEKIPSNLTVDDAGRWLVPVDYVEIAEEQEEAAALALNGAQEAGGWDDRLLAEVLKDLVNDGGMDALVGTGFDSDDLDQMMREAERMNALALSQMTGSKDQEDSSESDEEEEDGSEDGENTEEKGEEGEEGKHGLPSDEEIMAIFPTKPGDVWLLVSPAGATKHVIVCGDATDQRAWQQALDALDRRQFNGIFTSPPYAEQRKNSYGGIAESRYVAWWEDIQGNAARFLASDGSFFLNIKPHVNNGERALYVMDLVLAMARSWGWKLIDEFAWRRISAPGSWPNRFKNGFEPVYHFARQTNIKFRPKQASHPGEGVNIGSGHNDSTANYFHTRDGSYEWDGALPSNCIGQFGNAMKCGHPAAFPPLLPMFFMAGFSDFGDAWMDPFVGSANTIIAAEKSMRAGAGIELLPLYVARALDNVMRNTGLQAMKVNSGGKNDR